MDRDRVAHVLEARGVTKQFRSGMWPRRATRIVLRGADLELRADVVDRLLQGAHRIVGAGLGHHDVEGGVDDALGGGALAALEHLVDELGDDHRPVDRVGGELTTGGGTLAGHGQPSFFAPYRLRACLRSFTPEVSRVPRMIL